MRIAFVVVTFPVISETFILNQITGLIELGHDVHVFASNPGNMDKVHEDVFRFGLLERTSFLKRPANPVTRVLKGFPLLAKGLQYEPKTTLKTINPVYTGPQIITLRPLYSLIPFIYQGPFDIVHAHFGPSGKLGALVKRIGLTRRVVVSFHGYDFSKGGQAYLARRYSGLFRDVDLVTVNTSHTSSRVEGLGCPLDKIAKLPVGLDTQFFSFKPRCLREGEAPRLLTVSRLVEKKGVAFAIEAMPLLVSQFPTLRYDIIGEGPLKSHLEQLARDKGVAKHIVFWGSQPSGIVRSLMSEAHIFVLPSITAADGNEEGQGLVLQEAQASGLPVVATDHNGFPEGMLAGQSGFLVPERDVVALADTLLGLLNHPERWPDMGAAGRRFVEQKYDIRKLNRLLVGMYESLLARRPLSNLDDALGSEAPGIGD